MTQTRLWFRPVTRLHPKLLELITVQVYGTTNQTVTPYRLQSISEAELKLTSYTGNWCKESFEMKMCHLANGYEYIRQGR